jgi:hypothetical protein
MPVLEVNVANSKVTTPNGVFKGALVSLMCALQIADLITTIRALNNGAAELNPILLVAGKFDIARLIIFKLVALVICCYLVLRKSSVRPEFQMRRCLLYAALFAVIVFSNSTV